MKVNTRSERSKAGSLIFGEVSRFVEETAARIPVVKALIQVLLDIHAFAFRNVFDDIEAGTERHKQRSEVSRYRLLPQQPAQGVELGNAVALLFRTLADYHVAARCGNQLIGTASASTKRCFDLAQLTQH
jgi:hypothetical protein